MAGHSKWANIKHRKMAQDKKKGKIFTRLIREIMSAARQGGGDVKSNSLLRKTVETARSENLTADVIERAIKRGTGELKGADYEEVVFEGYALGGVAIVIKCLTDNNTRTVANVRSYFTKWGGGLGTSGSVAWMFDYKGVMYYPVSVASEDAMMEAAIEAGAEDVQTEGDTHRITCAPHDFGHVKAALETKFGKADAADFEYLPKQWQAVTDEDIATKITKLTHAIDDDDDVQTVTTNMDLSEALAAKLHG